MLNLVEIKIKIKVNGTAIVFPCDFIQIILLACSMS
jgi:hypothetical protein